MIDITKKYRTRGGKDVRVLCTDSGSSTFPVVALVGKTPYSFTKEGSFANSGEHPYDLIEVREPKRVWINEHSNGESVVFEDPEKARFCQRKSDVARVAVPFIEEISPH